VYFHIIFKNPACQNPSCGNLQKTFMLMAGIIVEIVEAGDCHEQSAKFIYI
jgi:hypothetical protein